MQERKQTDENTGKEFVEPARTNDIQIGMASGAGALARWGCND